MDGHRTRQAADQPSLPTRRPKSGPLTPGVCAYASGPSDPVSVVNRFGDCVPLLVDHLALQGPDELEIAVAPRSPVELLVHDVVPIVDAAATGLAVADNNPKAKIPSGDSGRTHTRRQRTQAGKKARPPIPWRQTASRSRKPTTQRPQPITTKMVMMAKMNTTKVVMVVMVRPKTPVFPQEFGIVTKDRRFPPTSGCQCAHPPECPGRPVAAVLRACWRCRVGAGGSKKRGPVRAC